MKDVQWNGFGKRTIGNHVWPSKGSVVTMGNAAADTIVQSDPDLVIVRQEDLESKTKAELQEYANINDMDWVDESKQTKEEMIKAISDGPPVQ